MPTGVQRPIAGDLEESATSLPRAPRPSQPSQVQKEVIKEARVEAAKEGVAQAMPSRAVSVRIADKRTRPHKVLDTAEGRG